MTWTACARCPKACPIATGCPPTLASRYRGSPIPLDAAKAFAAHMVDLLVDFLKPVAVEYELMRSSETYASGRFRCGARTDPGRTIRRSYKSSPRRCARRIAAQWSPFLPICPSCGQVNSTLVTAYHPIAPQRRVFLRAQLRRRPRMRLQGRAKRAGRQSQGAMEGGLGAALVRACKWTMNCTART